MKKDKVKKLAEQITKTLFGRMFLVGLALILQFGWILLTVMTLDNKYPIVSILIQLASVLAVLWIVSKNINPAYKLAWTILILAMPVAGTVIYFLFGKSRLARSLNGRFMEEYANTEQLLTEEPQTREQLEAVSADAAIQSRYIRDLAGFPVYRKTRTHYFHVGQELYKEMIAQLQKAEHFIFMEYFIINDGEMWQGILDILEEKARMGLDVRLIYDDVGCVNTLPADFRVRLERCGIRCQVFNPFVPVLSVVLNNRDHRKITVIDGHTAFTGGINLADEYINRRERFGYWKDTGVILQGDAAWSFTVMFLRMWSVLSGKKPEYEKYRPNVWRQEAFEDDGFVQPYCDTPLDNETVGENVYLNIINRAKKYVYIFTPYLISDNEVITALCLAAKSGIDVRIVTPGIPDKKMVFLLTQSYYGTLLQAGVRIFEYKPGFLHAKSFVCDDEIATVGTINLDYRSLYLHFECGVWLYRSEAVLQIKEDALSIFGQCREIRWEDWENRSLRTRFFQSVLRLFAPLGAGETNEEGLSVLASSGEFDVLITGDMGGDVEQLLLEHVQLPHVELMVAGHHGSKYSTSSELLSAIQPETAVISVGADNRYGHPAQETLERLAAAGTELYRTELQGTVLIRALGK